MISIGTVPFRGRGVVGAAALLLFVLAPSLAAQEQDIPQLGEARLAVVVAAYVEVSEARDDYHGVLGRTHEAQERDRLRAELQDRLDGILEEHEITQEEYEQIPLVISVNDEQRATFERLLAELEGGVGG